MRGEKSNDEVIAQLRQCLAADDGVPAEAAHKLQPEFRARGESALNRLASAQQAISASARERDTASAALQSAQAQAREWIRAVFNRLKGLPPGLNKSAVLASYGFTGGKLGELDNDRIMALLSFFSMSSAGQENPNAQLPADWLSTMSDLKTQIETQVPLATTGGRAERVRLRNEARQEADDWLSRSLAWLIYILPLRDRDPLLRDYGFTPRQLPRPKQPTAPTAGGNTPTEP